ncbi:MAG TPA: hypothetical protein VHM93_01720 [Candidatus Acidoferrum sp.]|jgi:hypothetical protein|nr:hypothetical protein [Candidatus Acidoferrum sp.]
MTINRRWLAREWLFLLGGLLVGIFTTVIGIRFGRIFPLWLYILLGWMFPLWLPYALFQLIRVTVWAIRTLRETVE